jgi:hypothetical protein
MVVGCLPASVGDSSEMNFPLYTSIFMPDYGVWNPLFATKYNLIKLFFSFVSCSYIYTFLFLIYLFTVHISSVFLTMASDVPAQEMHDRDTPGMILIIGSGVFGLSTAFALCQREEFNETKIVVIDRWPFPAPDGASVLIPT